MKFIIRRTGSSLDSKVPPVEGAYLGKAIIVDRRLFKTPEEHDQRMKVYGHKDRWHDAGTNHRFTETGIARDFEEERWLIDIVTLEELLSLQRRVTCELIIDAQEDDGTPIIEIYDDYRE